MNLVSLPSVLDFFAEIVSGVSEDLLFHFRDGFRFLEKQKADEPELVRLMIRFWVTHNPSMAMPEKMYIVFPSAQESTI